jgi:hypothetical protein
MNAFECLSYMSYMYMRNTIKMTVQVGISDESVRGRSPEWKYTFFIDDKGGEIY